MLRTPFSAASLGIATAFTIGAGVSAVNAAVTHTVPSHSFEDGTDGSAFGNYEDATIPSTFGWTWATDQAGWVDESQFNSSIVDNTVDQDIFAALQANENNDAVDRGTGKIWSDSSIATIQAGRQYTLKVDGGGRTALTGGAGDLILELWAGDPSGSGSEIASSGVIDTADSNASADADSDPDTLDTYSLSYTAPDAGAPVGDDLYIRLEANTVSGTSTLEDPFYQTNVDNVRLSSVPEPASLSLIGLGGLALISARRRQRRA